MAVLKDDLMMMVRNYLDSMSFGYQSWDHNIAYRSSLDSALEECTVLFTFMDEGILSRAICPINADASNIQNVVAYAMDANLHALGNIINVDMSDGQICVKFFLRLAEPQCTLEALHKMATWPVNFLDEHGDRLADILAGRA